MKVAYINPFVSAVARVLDQEAGLTVQRGQISMTAESVTSDDITVIIGVVGQVHGVVMYSLSERMAKSIVAAMIGQEVPVFDTMAESAISELANVITGLASSDLEESGFTCRLAPPTLIIGRGVYISTVLIQRLNIPIQTEQGTLHISVALNENPAGSGGDADAD
ncbi:MAG: chemotaxis protein CheX [Chloroflexota bacterium]